jgi:tryptophanyl-tRNA synthetase
VDCKKRFAESLNTHLVPFRDKRAKLSENPEKVSNILADGAKRAKRIAEQTMIEVREAIGIS